MEWPRPLPPHCGKQVIQCLRFANHFRGGSKEVHQLLLEAVCLAVPPPVAGPLLAHLCNPGALPSPTRLREHELGLDLALCMATRSRGQRVCRFGHTDSSPISGFDWLWTQYTEIPEHQVWNVFVAVRRMQNASRAYADVHSDSDGVVANWMVHTTADGEAWCKVILANTLHMVCPPAALGSGHRAVAHK